MTAPDPTVVALGRAVERAVRRVGELEDNLRELAADVLTLAERLTTGDAGNDAAPPFRAWLLAAGPDEAAAGLAELVTWIGQVYLRYDDAALSPCWLWHPDAVEELWWLRRAHADAYHPEHGSWLRAGDWHERHRPGVARRLKHLAKCDLTRHARRPATPDAPLGAHAPAVAAVWTADPATRAVPEPTEDQLAEAARHQARQFQTRSPR